MTDDITTSETSLEQWQIGDRTWLICGAFVTLIAAFLRFYDLALKPLHHDEGVNGFFLKTLFDSGAYKYDPANYHGPTLYYIADAFAKVFGLETVPVRASVAIFGVLTVVLVLYLKNYIGRIGSLAAALFVALSPGLVFISRYFIHEMFFVFLALAIVVSILLFFEKRPAGMLSVFWIVVILLTCFLPSTLNLAASIGGTNSTAVWLFRGVFFLVESALVFLVVRMLVSWNEGGPIYLILASACISLMVATKETAFITLIVLALSCLCVAAWQVIVKGPSPVEPLIDDLAPQHLTLANFRSGLGTGSDRLLIGAVAALTFIYLFCLFFSSFFSYPEGIGKAFEAYTLWFKTGSKDHTQNGAFAYLRWGRAVESPILILSALGAAIALVRLRHRFALFAAFWAFGIFAAYSIIPYKTPWLALSFLVPMCIIAGYGINELFASRNLGLKLLSGVLMAAAAALLGYQTYDLNFVRYDDNDMPYVYAHTKRGFLDLISRVEFYAAKSPNGLDSEIQIVSPDYWPMVWYLKAYPHANFYGHIVDGTSPEIIISKKDDQDAEVIRKFSAAYDYAGTYPLRPGVDLVLLVRKDIADPDDLPLYRIHAAP